MESVREGSIPKDYREKWLATKALPRVRFITIASQYDLRLVRKPLPSVVLFPLPRVPANLVQLSWQLNRPYLEQQLIEDNNLRRRGLYKFRFVRRFQSRMSGDQIFSELNSASHIR